MSADQNLLDHGQRLAALEAKVAELERKLGASDADATAAAQEASGFTFASDAGGSGDALNDPRIVELVGKGDKIHAIKLYRELTGVGLAEAKSAIDSM
jgi:ribosomal protein L7/L12